MNHAISSPAFFSRRGQFMPLTAFAVFTGFTFLIVVKDVYLVTKAKLQMQNLADAGALAIAALEARCINTVIDRDEWMNHMYADNADNPNRVPNISVANGHQFKGPDPENYAKQYAQIVATVNREQSMYQAAYNNFIGAGNQTSSNNAGVGSLAEILSEIQGFNDPQVRVAIWNTSTGEADADSQMSKSPTTTNSAPLEKIHNSGIDTLEFAQHEISVKVGKNKSETLTQLLQSSTPVGWWEPTWDANASLTMKTASGSESTIGAGVEVVKTVGLWMLPPVNVKAKSIAYVVKGSGTSAPTNSSMFSSGSKPPPQFRPTYYVQLGLPK